MALPSFTATAAPHPCAAVLLDGLATPSVQAHGACFVVEYAQEEWRCHPSRLTAAPHVVRLCCLTASQASDENKLFGGRMGTPKVAICPECGEVSLYLRDVSRRKK